MSEKSKTVHVLELRGQTENLQKALADLRKNFAGMKIPPELDKIFNKLGSSIDSILRKTEKGIIPREDFADTEKEVGKIKTAFEGLADALKALKNADDKKLASMIPKDTVDKLAAVNDAYKKYADTMLKVVEAEQKLTEAEEKKQAAKTKADSSESVRKESEKSKTDAETELNKYRDIIEALKEQEEATRALAKAQKELDKAKAEKGGKAIANRQAIVDAATQRKKDADDKVAGFDVTRMTAQKQALTEVEKATRAYSVAKKQAEEDAKALIDAETKEASAKATLTAVQNKSVQDQAAEAKALKALQDALVAVNPKYKNIAISGQTAGEKLEFLRREVEGLSEQELIKLKKSLKDASVDFNGFQQELEETKKTLKDTKDETAAADEALSQKAAFENKIKQFLGLSGAAQVLRRALRDAMQTITELDATMTEMSVVTDLGVSDYWDQLPQYTARANELGLAINDVYKADTLFYQQGLKTNEVVAISTETMKMARIAGLDTAEATDRMTAALRGFNMELNEASAQKIADVYSELAAITAADVDEISTAMTKTASIASSAGMEFETTAAFLSQIIETTRESAETAGTAMKTVIARFQELKKSPDEIGEVEGEIVDANAIETALRSVGVSLRDAGGQFRELDDVFLELSSKWGSLDKNTQRYIATIAAGSRQQSRFIAMMQDYGRTQELVTAANTSAGASSVQFEKTLESLGSKVAKLKNAWHEFTMGILESDLVKFGVDMLTKFLEVINKATSAFDGMGGSLMKIATTLAVFKLGSKIFDKLKVPLQNFFAEIIRKAGETGEQAANAAAEGVKKAQQAQTQKTTKDGKGDSSQQSAEQKTLGEKIKGFLAKKTGIKDFSKAKASSDEAKRYKKLLADPSAAAQKKQEKEAIERDYTFGTNGRVYKKGIKSQKGQSSVLSKEEADKVKQRYADLSKDIKEYESAEEGYIQASKDKWDSINSGLTEVGQSVSAVGMGISMLGGILSSLGLEEVGEGFAIVGNVVTALGGALMALPSIISAIQAVLSMPPLGIILIILGAVIASILIIVSIIKNMSPEKKLQDAAKAAEQAAQAADNAADSYNDLKNSLEGLDEQYKTLEKLTQGTKEWNEAILNINNSVLDLIEKYPELAKYVTQQDGYLLIDTNSSEVINVIKASQNRALMTKNISALATTEVSRAEAEVIKNSRDLTGVGIEELSKAVSRGEILIGENGFEKGTKTFEELGYTQEQLQSIYSTNKGNIGGLKEYGNMLLDTEAQKQASYSSMAVSVQQMANTSTFSNEEKQIMSNLVDGEDISKVYEKELKKISSIDYTDNKNLSEPQKIQRDSAIREVYGDDVKLEDLTNEQIQAAIAQTKSMPKTIAQIEGIPAMMDRLAGNNSESITKMLTHMFTDWDGSNMTLSDFNELAELSEEQLKKIYKDLGTSAKEIFGTEDKFLSQVKKTEGILIKQNKAMQTSIEMMFGKDAKLPSWNIPPEIGSQLLLKFQDVFNNANSETFQGFYEAFNGMLTNLTEEQQTIFASILESVDWEDTTELATLPDKLNEAGLEFEALGVNIYDFIDITKTATHAIAKLTSEELATVLNDVYAISKNINNGEQGRVFSEQQYNSILAADPTLKREFAKTADGYMYLGSSMQDLRTAVLENTRALKGEDPETAKKTLNALGGFEELITTFNNTIDTSKAEKAEYDEASETYNAAAAEKEVAQENLDEAQNTMNTVGSNPFLYSADTTFAVNSDHPELAGMAQAIQWIVGLFSEGAAEIYDAATGTMVERASDTINKSTAIISDAEERMSEAKPIIDNYANAQNKEYAAYNKIEAGNTEMPIEQLVAFFTQLDANIQSKGGRLEDYGIEGLRSNLDFSILANSKPDELKNWFAQVYSLLADKTNLENAAEKTPEEALGNDIMSVVVDGVQGLQDYFSDYLNNKGTNKVLKGSMIKFASDYGISEKILQQFFDADGRVITEKFDEFIELLNEKEEEQRLAIPKEQTIDLLNQVKDALVKTRQREIDTLSEKFDAMAEASDKVISQLQEIVNEERRIRQNQETEKNITDKYNQLAYLSMDTSGNGLEKLALQEEIKQAEQDYQDTLVDQEIQKLQDANAKAQEQRERQIALMQAQLDLWKNSEQIYSEANTIIINSIGGDLTKDYTYTELGQLILGQSEGLSTEEKENLINELTQLIYGYSDYRAPAFETGGLADFTGPAWLDGTKSRPEYVLNADQTERFFALVDVLDGFKDKGPSNEKSGDNYFDININVDKLENDYDVEQVADKIRRMIYEDASYRNVNAVNLIR